MEKKVIKFNLVGAICIFLLVVALIIGLIVGIPKIIESARGDKEISNGNSNNKQISGKDDNKIDENKEYTETVKLQSGEERKVKMKVANSDKGYTMKYDYEKFHFDNQRSDLDTFISLYSSTIKLEVIRENIEFEKVQEKIERERQQEREKQRQLERENREAIPAIIEDDVIRYEINGTQAIKKIYRTEARYENAYYIRINEKECFVIRMDCGKDFENEIVPIMEHMIESFKIK